jgi:hypothetical protein
MDFIIKDPNLEKKLKEMSEQFEQEQEFSKIIQIELDEDKIEDEYIEEINEIQVNEEKITKLSSSIIFEEENQQELEVEIVEEVDFERFEEMENSLYAIEDELKSLERGQDAIFNLLHQFGLKRDSDQNRRIDDSSINILRKNLEMFNSRLVILDKSANNEDVSAFLKILNKISLNLISNYFYIFSKNNSPVKSALSKIGEFERNRKCQVSFDQTRFVLKTIDKYSTYEFEFERYMGYSSFVFERDMVLNSVILFNESITQYILQSIKFFSKEIHLIIEEKEKKDQEYKVPTEIKNFFIWIFLKESGKYENMSEILNKDILNKIQDKLEKLHKTATHKKEGDLFSKLAMITYRVRHLRNNMSHGNMTQSLDHIMKEYPEIIRDYKYIAVEKDILKIKHKSKQLSY